MNVYQTVYVLRLVYKYTCDVFTIIIFTWLCKNVGIRKYQIQIHAVI